MGYRDLQLPNEAAGETVVGAPTWMVGGWAGVAGDRQAQVRDRRRTERVPRMSVHEGDAGCGREGDQEVD